METSVKQQLMIFIALFLNSMEMVFMCCYFTKVTEMSDIKSLENMIMKILDITHISI